jgi:cytochrome c553
MIAWPANLGYTITLLVLCIPNAHGDTIGNAPISLDGSKLEVCSGCHGPGGNSQNQLRPILAGQDREYVVRQLRYFKSGKRGDSMMNSIASNLDDREISELAAYFARQAPSQVSGNPPQSERGRQIYKENCWGCHGTNALGQEGYPKLAGQHPEYLIRQLANFKEGSRTSPTMQAIAIELSSEDIRSLGEYLGSLNGKNGKQPGWVLGSGD